MRHQRSDRAGSWQPTEWGGHGQTDKVDHWEQSPATVHKRLELGEPLVLVDVREAWEHDVVTLPEARLIPLNELRYRAEEELEWDDDIVVYSHHGLRSLEAASILWELGYESVRSLAGGIHRWSLSVDTSLPTY